MPLYLVVMALAPAIFLLFYVWLRDRYEREPLSLVIWTFGAGILSALLALLIGLGLATILPDGTGFWGTVVDSFFKVAAVEEACKLLAVYLVAYRNPNFNEPMDGIVYAGAASLGFAALENVLYVLKYGWVTALMRAVLAVPAHFLFGVTMGYYLSRYRFGRRQRVVSAALIYLMPVLLHALFDVLALNMAGGVDTTRDLAFGALMYALMGLLWVRGSSEIDQAESRSPFRWRARWRLHHYHAQQHMIQVVGHCPNCHAGVPAEASYCYRCGAIDPLGIAQDRAMAMEKGLD